MAEQLMKVVVNVETGEQKYIPLSAEELAEREAMAAAYLAEQEAREAEAEAKEAARLLALDKLTELGLTAEEIESLRG